MKDNSPIGTSLLILLLVNLLLLPLLNGCGAQQSSDKGQVVAKVNGDDITIHQFNFAVSQSGGKTLAPTKRMDLLEKMINRQLAVQQAMKMKIDRQPNILMRLEEARQDILAAAYAYEIGSANPPPKPREISAYYNEHPGLFAKRRLYRLREIVLPAEAPLLEELKSRLQGPQDIAQVISWLRSQKREFGDQRITRTAEKLPTQIADKLCEAAQGTVVSFTLPQAFIIYQVLSFEEMPVTEKEAEDAIRNFLRKRGEVALYKEELARLRESAVIEIKELPD